MKLNLLKLLFIGILFYSCSESDDNSSIIPETNKKYIESVTKPDLTEINRDHFFEYNDGLLTSATGFTILVGNYEYDSGGKLIAKTNYNGQFKYEYDDQNRITKENKVGTNDYIELIYQSDKVLTKRYYEFGGGPQNGGGSNLEQRELQLDSQGRIIKMIDLAQDESAIDVEYKEFQYDNIGNIIKITTKYLDNPTETTIDIEYDDKVNPYYVAFEKYYDQTYYLEYFTGLIIYNSYGLTPNNIVSRGTENRDFVYDKDGYPVSWQRFFADGSSNAEALVEYYE